MTKFPGVGTAEKGGFILGHSLRVWVHGLLALLPLGLWGSRTSERREGPGKAGMDAPSGTCPIVVTKNFQKESFSLVHGLRICTTWKRHGSWCIRNKLGIVSPLQIVHHHWINGKVILWRVDWWSPLPGGRSILITELQSTPLGPPCWYSWPLPIPWLWIVGERWAWHLILIGLSVLWLFTRLAHLLARVFPMLHSLASTALDPQTSTQVLPNNVTTAMWSLNMFSRLPFPALPWSLVWRPPNPITPPFLPVFYLAWDRVVVLGYKSTQVEWPCWVMGQDHVMSPHRAGAVLLSLS